MFKRWKRVLYSPNIAKNMSQFSYDAALPEIDYYKSSANLYTSKAEPESLLAWQLKITWRVAQPIR